MIYASRRGAQRLAIFGNKPALDMPASFTALNNRLTITSDQGERAVKIFYRDPAVLQSSLGARYVGDIDRMFDTYAELLPEMQAWFAERYPKQAGDSDFAWRTSRARFVSGNSLPVLKVKPSAAVCAPSA